MTTEELTPAMYRAILAIHRTTSENGHLPAIDLGPWRASTARALSYRGITTNWYTGPVETRRRYGRRVSVCRLNTLSLTDYGKTLIPAALEWERSQ